MKKLTQLLPGNVQSPRKVLVRRLQSKSACYCILSPHFINACFSVFLQLPFPANEHHLPPGRTGLGVSVYEDEPSSIIAYTLSSQRYYSFVKVHDVSQTGVPAAILQSASAAGITTSAPTTPNVATTVAPALVDPPASSSGALPPAAPDLGVATLTALTPVVDEERRTSGPLPPPTVTVASAEGPTQSDTSTRKVCENLGALICCCCCCYEHLMQRMIFATEAPVRSGRCW